MIAAFCEREGVSTAAFFQRRRKLGGDLGGGETLPARPAARLADAWFLPVRIASAEPIEIEPPNGVRVPGDAARTLDAVLAAVHCAVAPSPAEARACCVSRAALKFQSGLPRGLTMILISSQCEPRQRRPPCRPLGGRLESDE